MSVRKIVYNIRNHHYMKGHKYLANMNLVFWNPISDLRFGVVYCIWGIDQRRKPEAIPHVLLLDTLYFIAVKNNSIFCKVC